MSNIHLYVEAVNKVVTTNTAVLYLFNEDRDVMLDDLKDLVTDRQIAEHLGIEKPESTDFTMDQDGETVLDNDAYDEAVEEYEQAIIDFRDNMEWEDLDNFLTIGTVEGNVRVSLSNLKDLGTLIDEMSAVDDDDDWNCVLAIYNTTCNDLVQAIEEFSSGDFYWYPGMDVEEVVEQQIDEGLWGEIPSNIRFYLDTEKMARDLGHDGYTYDSEAGGTICVH